jgi:hypothetical protein
LESQFLFIKFEERLQMMGNARAPNALVGSIRQTTPLSAEMVVVVDHDAKSG